MSSTDLQRKGRPLPQPKNVRAREERFVALYDAHYHRILGYVQRRIGHDDAPDIVADIFAIGWRRLSDVPDGERALYWLYGTARRVLANHMRSQKRRARLQSAVEIDLAVSNRPGAEAESRGLATALRRLRDDDRELLLLVAWEGLDPVGISVVLGCSRNAARIRIHRARRRLAQAMVEEEAGGGSRRGGQAISVRKGLEETL